MAYVTPQPPNVDGLCQFIDNSTICMAVQNKLNSLRSSFTVDANNAAFNTFWLVSLYNSTVAGTAIDATNNYPIINGDTAIHCLSLYDEAQNGTTQTM